MSPESSLRDKPSIRLPLPRIAKWGLMVWVALMLLSPFLVLFHFSALQVVVLAVVLGGFFLPFLLGRLPGELEAAPDHRIFLTPRAHAYAWLYLLCRENTVVNPRPMTFSIPETSLVWDADKLCLQSGDASVCLGHGDGMKPVRDWLVGHGVQPMAFPARG